MGWAERTIQELQAAAMKHHSNRVTVRPKGHSMEPLICSGQAVELCPVRLTEVQAGDLVLCRVYGSEYLHLVLAVGPRGAQIASARGRINGWTRQVFGRVVSVDGRPAPTAAAVLKAYAEREAAAPPSESR